MKCFSIVADNYQLDVYLSTIFIDEDGTIIERFGNFIVFVNDKCLEFPTSSKLYDFLQHEMDNLIDPLPF